MTCVILCRSLLRLSTARGLSCLIMTTMTTTSFECSHVISHGTMMTPTYVLVPKYLTHVTQDITVIGIESSIPSIKARKAHLRWSVTVSRREASTVDCRTLTPSNLARTSARLPLIDSAVNNIEANPAQLKQFRALILHYRSISSSGLCLRSREKY